MRLELPSNLHQRIRIRSREHTKHFLCLTMSMFCQALLGFLGISWNSEKFFNFRLIATVSISAYKNPDGDRLYLFCTFVFIIIFSREKRSTLISNINSYQNCKNWTNFPLEKIVKTHTQSIDPFETPLNLHDTHSSWFSLNGIRWLDSIFDKLQNYANGELCGRRWNI